ncbi:DUF2975 domain-containing protein [Thiothrix fructosivorans]|uniref:DUF2975 domain-containing protein n=1 Tax=Thiothrix fructosivorans TaxID=111770 RepID=A0A8B0SL56_9GAMM|nr:DUF2975 domain-containing protein [Thiothrix fructosivorans]MBO0612930.1 DUF2975 domain-containing protein [Thiothrix fructosivorans]QTX11619.1 DUF2975 domain-containing protein [Thiothrix fructosivorans]
MRLHTTRLKHWLAPAAKVISVLLLLSNTLLWWLSDGQALILKNFATLTNEPLQLTPFGVWMGWGLSTLHLLIMMWGIWAMAGVFRWLAQGDYFHADIARQLRRFGVALMVFGVASPVVRLLMVLAVTLENPEGHQVIAISLEMNDVLVVLIGALMVMLAHALQAAAVIADDNRQIV